MTKHSKNKIISGLHISLGTALTFLTLKALLDLVKGILWLFAYVPADQWTPKHSIVSLSLLISGIAVVYLGMTFGIGNINLGIKKLKSIQTQQEINKLLKQIEVQHGIKNKNNNP